jgi:hypothetical protein
MPKENNRPVGENSPNLVTLVSTIIQKHFYLTRKNQVFGHCLRPVPEICLA